MIKRDTVCLTVFLLAVLLLSCSSTKPSDVDSMVANPAVCAGTDWTLYQDCSLSILSDEGLKAWTDEQFSCLEWIKGKPVTIVLQEGVSAIPAQGLLTTQALLLSVSIPKSVKSIASGSLEGAQGLLLNEGNPWYSYSDGFLVENATKTLLYCEPSAAVVHVPEGITTVSGAFISNAVVEEIFLPDSLQSILDRAFNHCSKLKTLHLPKGLKYCDELVFDLNAIEELTLPPNVQLDAGESEDSGMFGEALKRIIFTGSGVNVQYKDFRLAQGLQQAVFLCGKPNLFDDAAFQNAADGFQIYYLNDYRSEWALSGETEWNGIPLIGIDSLTDLPILK